MGPRAFVIAFLVTLALGAVPLRDLSGHVVDPFDTRAPAIVFLFVRTDCPITNRYAPEMRRLSNEFTPAGVVFWLVYPDAAEQPAAIRKHIADYELPGQAVRDPDHALVAETGVRVTPEAAVFIRREGRFAMVYRGRIDDRYVDIGRERPQAATHDLANALNAVVHGKMVRTIITRAVGCYISDIRLNQ